MWTIAMLSVGFALGTLWRMLLEWFVEWID
jgi:hypothetical protein